MSSNGAQAALLLASALTKLHPGAGRSPGVVDLPVIRDPLGYYFVPGTMLKGTLKSLLYRKFNNKNKNNENQEKKTIECLFGPDTEDSEKFAGMLTFHDLYPLLVPAPSPELGIAYVTSPYLLSRAAELAIIAGDKDLADDLRNLLDSDKDNFKDGETAVIVGWDKEGSIRVGAYRVKAKPASAEIRELKKRAEACSTGCPGRPS